MDKREPKVEHYEILVLGSGEAGKYIAWKMASMGKRTALIERRYIGGSCPNIACLPNKNLIHSAKVAQLAAQVADFGLHPGEPGVDMRVVRGRKRAMVEDLVKVHQDRFAAFGVEVVLGEGRFIGPRIIQVNLTDGGLRTITGEHVVISTGSRATIDPIPGLVESAPLTHVEALELSEVPERLIILGGGYVGLEFAQAMRRFGSQVTLVERNERLLHREDVEVSEAVMRIFQAENIEIVTRAVVKEIRGHSGEQVSLHLEHPKIADITGTHLLVATGRTPNTDGIGLSAAGVAITPEGFIQVDGRLQSTAPGVFAVGDCAGSPHFTHIAFDDHRIVCDVINGGQRTTLDAKYPPFSSSILSLPGWALMRRKRSRAVFRIVW